MEKSDKVRIMSHFRGGSRFFFRRGCTRLLLYFNTNKPHSFFWKIPVVSENRRSSAGGGGMRTPCTLPLDPPLHFSPGHETSVVPYLVLHFLEVWKCGKV